MSGGRGVRARVPGVASESGLGYAGVGGIGSGTGLVAMGQSFGPSTTLGALILYLAPAASFVIGSALYYVQVQSTRYFERRQIKNAMKTLQVQLDNPLTSEEHKAEILKLLEAAEKAVANAELQRIKQLGQLRGQSY